MSFVTADCALMTGKPYLIRSGKGRRQSTNWVISSELISVQFTQSGKIRKRKERSYENRGHYRKNPAGFDVSCLWAQSVPEVSADASPGRSVGTVSRRAGRFTLCVVCGCGAGHQRSAVSDWEVRSPGDCVERPSGRQHNCLPLDNAAQRGTAGGSGNHMLGDSVLALPCFVCAPVGAKSLASNSTLLGCCGICVLACVQTAKCFGNSGHTNSSELNLRCRATTVGYVPYLLLAR